MKKKKLKNLSLKKMTISSLKKNQLKAGANIEPAVPISFQASRCCWTWYGVGCHDDWTYAYCETGRNCDNDDWSWFGCNTNNNCAQKGV